MIDFRFIPVVAPFLRRIRRWWQPPLHRTESRVDCRVFGSAYGGWPVIEGSLSPESRVYSFGVGHDISFDLAVMARYGCAIEAFDPTPRCVAWLEQQNIPEGFHFHSVGLSNCTEVLRFFAPPENQFVSYTVAERADSPEVVELPVRPLDELMRDQGDRKIDFLKMDIEGSEYAVVADMLEKGIFPTQLCIEFHHRMFGYLDDQTRDAVSRLRTAGYRLHYVSPGGREYGFHLQTNTR